MQRSDGLRDHHDALGAERSLRAVYSPFFHARSLPFPTATSVFVHVEIPTAFFAFASMRKRHRESFRAFTDRERR